ncbi:MAG: hypothetical protein R6U17_04300 [Thermoplasmata archaeon]
MSEGPFGGLDNMEYTLTKQKIMLLINTARKHDINHLSIEEPYFHNTILDIEFKDEHYLVSLRGKSTFDYCTGLDNYCHSSDIPGFLDYKDCLISSGLIHFDNWNEFVDWVEYLYRTEIDPTLSSKSVFLSIDSNLAYFRFISRRFPLDTDKGQISAEDFDYLLSTIVESEVDHHIRDKYGNSDLKMMGMYTNIGDIRYNFRNRGKLMTRKAKFATQELSYLRGNLNAARVRGNVSKTDAEKNDIRIVESLERFSWDKNIATALISTDRNMGSHAENSEIPYFILEIPHSIDRQHEVSSSVVLNLLHDLALTFGAVKIPEMQVTLFGIWGGKTDKDYREEAVQAWVNPGSPLNDSIKRDMAVIQSLVNIPVLP